MSAHLWEPVGYWCQPAPLGFTAVFTLPKIKRMHSERSVLNSTGGTWLSYIIWWSFPPWNASHLSSGTLTVFFIWCPVFCALRILKNILWISKWELATLLHVHSAIGLACWESFLATWWVTDCVLALWWVFRALHILASQSCSHHVFGPILWKQPRVAVRVNGVSWFKSQLHFPGCAGLRKLYSISYPQFLHLLEKIIAKTWFLRGLNVFTHAQLLCWTDVNVVIIRIPCYSVPCCPLEFTLWE